MSEDEIANEIESLDAQITLQQRFLDTSRFESEKPPLQATIRRLTGARHRLEKLLTTSLVIESVPDTATGDDIDERRQGQPVRCGEKFYSPIPTSDDAIVMPSCLLRSAVFGISKGGDVLDKQRIGSHSRYTIKMTGTSLNTYDRRVFIACLEHYQQTANSRRLSRRDPQALASDDEDEWIETTDWQLAQSMGAGFGTSVRKSIQASLARLNDARLDISCGQDRLLGIKLLEVRPGADGEATPTSAPRARKIVAFRILDRFVYLYLIGGAKASTIINKAALGNYTQALASWLACYYSSHRRPYPTSIAHLRAYCGAAGKPYHFRHQLKNALTEFKAPETPKQFRVADFEVTKTEVTVHLARWKS